KKYGHLTRNPAKYFGSTSFPPLDLHRQPFIQLMESNLLSLPPVAESWACDRARNTSHLPSPNPKRPKTFMRSRINKCSVNMKNSQLSRRGFLGTVVIAAA